MFSLVQINLSCRIRVFFWFILKWMWQCSFFFSKWSFQFCLECLSWFSSARTFPLTRSGVAAWASSPVCFYSGIFLRRWESSITFWHVFSHYFHEEVVFSLYWDGARARKEPITFWFWSRYWDGYFWSDLQTLPDGGAWIWQQAMIAFPIPDAWNCGFSRRLDLWNWKCWVFFFPLGRCTPNALHMISFTLTHPADWMNSHEGGRNQCALAK